MFSHVILGKKRILAQLLPKRSTQEGNNSFIYKSIKACIKKCKDERRTGKIFLFNAKQESY